MTIFLACLAAYFWLSGFFVSVLVLNSDPSDDTPKWSPLAVLVFSLLWPLAAPISIMPLPTFGKGND